MRNQVTAYLDHAITFLLLIVVGLTPLLFFNQTTEFYDMPKLIFLVVATVILLGLWIFSWIIKGKVVITRTPLDIPLLFMLGAIVVSTYFSASRDQAIYGNFPTVHGSAVSWVTYILLYFITVSHLKSLTKIRTFLYTLYGSALIVAAISLLSFFHIFLPLAFVRAVNFTPTGSSFSTLALLILLLPLPLFSIVKTNKYLPLPLALTLAIVFSITIALIGSVPTYVVLFIGFALCLLISRMHQVNKKTFALFFVPVAITVLTLIVAYVPFTGNKLQQAEANFPKEIQLPFPISWKISASAFRDAPFVGTGPSSYLFNFTSYKPVEFNQTNFWNFSFDSAYNEFLQVLGTLGIFGFLALLSLCIVTLISSWKNLSINNTEANQDSTHILLPALAISGLLSIVLLAIHPTTLVSTIITLFILATLMVSQKSIRERVVELSMGIKASTSGNKQFDLFPVLAFIVFLIAAIPVLYITVNSVAADYYHRRALSQANSNGNLTYTYLQKAESLNPRIDLYRVDMAQTNFALANAIAAQKGATSAAALSNQDKQTIQTLLSQAIQEGRVGVALSPRSSRNWIVLASIYRNITGVTQNALAFALDAYGRAIQLDPLNPTLRLNVGGIYYAAKNYDLAIRFFTDAANLKPDYANAYYNLSIALRDKGDLQNAGLVAQQTVTLLSKDTTSADYKAASQLLADLKTKIAAATKAQAAQQAQQTPVTPEVTPTGTQTAPAAQTNSALGNQQVPNVNVSNLNNPPQVTPAPSIKPNQNTYNPTKATPAPTIKK